jgi:hypothetical protein
MHNFSANPTLRAAMERAHAERNEAIRTFFAAIFARKERPAHGAAQAA